MKEKERKTRYVGHEKTSVFDGISILQRSTETLFVDLLLGLVSITRLGLQEVSVPIPHGEIGPHVILPHQDLNVVTASVPGTDISASEREESLFCTPPKQG